MIREFRETVSAGNVIIRVYELPAGLICQVHQGTILDHTQKDWDYHSRVYEILEI